MRTRAGAAGPLLALCLAAPCATAQPYLFDSLQTGLAPRVEERALGDPGPGGVGLLPPAVTGLPADLWVGSRADTLADLVSAVDPAVPVLQALLVTLLLAEAEPPQPGDVTLLAARLDRLRAQGAVEEALALVERSGHAAPALFTRWAELSLLVGRPGEACAEIAARPTRTDDLGLRIYCLARAGEWDRAALSHIAATGIGALDSRDAALMALFLDPEAQPTGPLTPPVRPTPLEVRLFEAIGEPLPTDPLPLPFAVQDLSGDNGWRAQLLAAERLARAGSLPANRLLGLYTRRQAAASGGIWDRVAALQEFEAALKSGRPDRIGPALRAVWPQMASAGLLVPFAELFADDLEMVELSGRASEIALHAAALSPDYESLLHGAQGTEGAFLAAIAAGKDPGATQVPALPHARPVAAAFGDAPMPMPLEMQLSDGRLGEVILRAIALFSAGAAGNGDDLTDALAAMRQIGLEGTARQAALQIMLLDAERARR